MRYSFSAMDWTAPVDLYCERLGLGLWAEPLNAISNAGFPVAAAIVLVLARRDARTDWPVAALALLVAAIGIGSFLFHTVANRWSALADVMPITIFIYGYLALALRRFLRLSWLATVAWLAIFFSISWRVEIWLRPALSGSAAYVPPLLAMWSVGGVLAARRHRAAPYVLSAGVIFLLSLTLRTLDQPLCGTIPVGTHWLWHLLNAATLFILLLGARATGPGAELALQHR